MRKTLCQIVQASCRHLSSSTSETTHLPFSSALAKHLITATHYILVKVRGDICEKHFVLQHPKTVILLIWLSRCFAKCASVKSCQGHMVQGRRALSDLDYGFHLTPQNIFSFQQVRLSQTSVMFCTVSRLDFKG